MCERTELKISYSTNFQIFIPVEQPRASIYPRNSIELQKTAHLSLLQKRSALASC